MTVLLQAEFDQFQHPHPQKGQVIYREMPRGGDWDTEVVLCVGETEHVLVRSCRDQWGCFYRYGDITVAQEDTTRSALDAIIQVLQQLKEDSEISEPRTRIYEVPRNSP